VRTIKEKTCYVSANPAKEDKDVLAKTEDFRLPDGKSIRVGRVSVGNCLGVYADYTGWVACSSVVSGSKRPRSCSIRRE
jgi:hypothetical protein